MLDKNTAHCLRRNCKEMSAVLPLNLLVPDQPEIRFVDECCGLEGVARAFAAHVMPCQTTQIPVDDLHELVCSLAISLARFTEQVRDLIP